MEYQEAVYLNDEAHRKSIREVDYESTTFGERQKIFADIEKEAKMWLRHLDSIHGRR